MSSLRRSGFTLVELMVALVIVGFATTSVLAWSASLRQLSYLESLGSSAIALCQFKMEEIRALRFHQLAQEFFPLETDLILDTRGTPEGDDDIKATRTVTIEDVLQGDVPMKKVTVRCAYMVCREQYTEEIWTWVSIAG